MNRRVHPDFKQAIRLLEEGQARTALKLAERLVASATEMVRLDGHICRGIVYEDGGIDLEPDFGKAMDSYRRASLIAPCADTFIHLARMSMKMNNYPAALRFLTISEDHEQTPEVLLGFGLYHEAHIPEGASAAKSYFVKAALRGRFAGFFGYSRVARSIDQNFRALGMDCMRIVSGPFIALAIGVRARYQF